MDAPVDLQSNAGDDITSWLYPSQLPRGEMFKRCRRGSLDPESGRVLQMHSQRHRACEGIMADFMVKSYARYCFDGSYHKEDQRSIKCQSRNEQLTATYGSAPEGLKKLHAETTLQLDVLGTCKRVYHEASLIPYSTLTGELVPVMTTEQLCV